MDWIGVALALVGIGIALLPLADQFNFLKPYAVPGGVALILAGRLLCLVSIWERIQARREAKPRSCVAPAPIRSPTTFKPEPRSQAPMSIVSFRCFSFDASYARTAMRRSL